MGERGQVEDAGNPEIVLSVLTSIERDCAITQRKLARELGIALGLTNAYLRRCERAWSRCARFRSIATLTI